MVSEFEFLERKKRITELTVELKSYGYFVFSNKQLLWLFQKYKNQSKVPNVFLREMRLKNYGI